jgi:glutathione S-transferase
MLRCQARRLSRAPSSCSFEPVPHPSSPIVLHWFPLSGHAHRAQLFLSLLGLPTRLELVELGKRVHKQPPFLAKNAFGQVPVLEDGDVVIADSNAILVYLATRYDAEGSWLPRDPVGAAGVARWMAAAAGPLAFGPAALRRAAVFGAAVDRASATALAEQLFAVMEGELAARPYLLGERPSLADLAMYTYTAHAPEGGLSLAGYPRLRGWLERIAALPGFVAMAASPTEVAAT